MEQMRLYRYYSMNESFGYVHVDIYASSRDEALAKGVQEFNRQFGSGLHSYYFLLSDTEIPPVNRGYNISICDQRELCQAVMYGYVTNFKGYADRIRQIAQANRLAIPTDEHIKYLFANKLARRYKKAYEVKLIDCSIALIELLGVLTTQETADKALSEYMSKRKRA